MVKAVFAASPTQSELATTLEWDYNAEKLTVPTFLTAATGNADSNTICPLEGLQKFMTVSPSLPQKLMCRRNDGDHGEYAVLWRWIHDRVVYVLAKRRYRRWKSVLR